MVALLHYHTIALATPTKWRKGKYKLETIIEEQALELSHVVKGIKPKFKGFVGRL